MKEGILSGTSKDFHEKLEYLDKGRETLPAGPGVLIRQLDQYARLAGIGYTITNFQERGFERVNLDFLNPSGTLDIKKFFTIGYSYTIQHMKKEYLPFNLHYFAEILQQELRQYPTEKKSEIEAFIDLYYRLNPSDEYYTRIFQQVKVLKTDTNNDPYFLLNICSDITYLKKKENATLAIKTHQGKIRFFHFCSVGRKVIDHGSFSDREISILSLLEKNLSSKQIAEQLFISPHTVDTHRRNMLEMTNCIDTTALIVYCKMLKM